jgi:hypothetical protein
MKKMESKGTTSGQGEAQGRRYPVASRLLPPPDRYALYIPLKSAKKCLGLVISSTPDCRELRIRYSTKQVGDVDLTKDGRVCRTAKGEIVTHELMDFGVYDEERVYKLETPFKGRTLLLKRGNEGSLTMCIEGTDLSKAVTSKDETRPYVGIHRIDGRIVGYTVEDFLGRVNQAFALARFEIPLG